MTASPGSLTPAARNAAMLSVVPAWTTQPGPRPKRRCASFDTAATACPGLLACGGHSMPARTKHLAYTRSGYDVAFHLRTSLGTAAISGSDCIHAG